jgi:dipeptidyl aminopeptidase/acylaminoacyl peptidase
MTTASQETFLDQLLQVPRLYDPAVSRDGRWVAWTWLGAGSAADVYAAALDGSSPPVQLTNTDEETLLVSWAPDSQSVIVTQDRAGDERYALYRVWLSQPGVMEALTEKRPNYFLRGGELTPDGRILVYAMNYDVDRGEEIEATWVYRKDLETGKIRPLARPERAAHFVPVLNDAGTQILYERQDLNPAGSQVWLVNIDGSNDREILNVGADKKTDARWLPDSNTVLFLAETGTHRRLGTLDPETGDQRILIDDPNRNIEDAYALRGMDRPTVAVVDVHGARSHATLLDVETGVERPFDLDRGALIPLRYLGDEEWVARVYSATQPSDVVRYRLNDGSMSSVTGLWSRTDLRPDDFVPAEDFHWQSSDGLPVQGWLYRTRRPAVGTIVLIHGGPTSHSEDAFNAEVQYFASQGFNVLAPNYRGSTGFSLAFQESIKEEGWGGREQEDIRTGIEALIAAGIARPGKVGVTGTSYGGYSSWHAATHFDRETVAASAPICGMTDLVVDYDTTRPDLRPYSEEMMGGSPEQQPERYRERSPINFVRDIQGDLLIVQGMRDPNVTPENVRAVREALDHAGIRYDNLTFEDEGHGISRPENQRRLYHRLAEFFRAAFS